MRKIVLSLFFCYLLGHVFAQEANTRNPLLADPTLFFKDGKYYLYGTVGRNSDSGFKAYKRND